MKKAALRKARDGSVIAELGLMKPVQGDDELFTGKSAAAEGIGFSLPPCDFKAIMKENDFYLYLPENSPMGYLRYKEEVVGSSVWEGMRYFDIDGDGMVVERGVVFRIIELLRGDEEFPHGYRFRLECEGFAPE